MVSFGGSHVSPVVEVSYLHFSSRHHVLSLNLNYLRFEYLILTCLVFVPRVLYEAVDQLS